MLNGVIDALTDINYTGPLLDQEHLEKAIDGGPKSVAYTGLVHSLAEELRDLCSLEESVSQTNGPDDASSFVLELSSFLKELGCPYMNLITGHMSSRLQSTSDRLLLLDYLLSELMAARMVSIDRPQETNAFMEVTIQETPTAKDLKDILAALKMTAPPAGVTPKLLFEKLKAKLRIVLQQEGANYVGRPVFNQSLTEAQWKEVDAQHKSLLDDYKKRREMLITRLDCTIQSFEWSGKGVDKREQIQTLYRPLRNAMKISSSVKVSDFLAARSGLLAMKKTSDAAVRINTRSQVNKVVIGRVPDRGGRPSEQQPPPPEMPSWQQQRTQGGGRGGGGGGGGRGGSGFGGGGQRVQGGWNSQDNRGGHAGRGRGQGFQQDNRGNQGFQQDNNRGNQGYQQDNNRGNQGYQQDNNRGNQSYQQDSNRSSTGYSDNRNTQGYNDNRNNQGYNDNNRSANFKGNQSYQDPNVYQDSTNNRGFQNNSNNRGNYNQSQGYQAQPSGGGGYQSQSNTGYQNQSQSQGFQSKGRYQNEHDDRAGGYDNRGGSGGGRGRSSYNRGGRN